METKENLTNEAISKRFDNQFDLVNYAIHVAQDMIHAGRGPRVKTNTENPALQVLAEITAGKDIFEESSSKKPKPILKDFEEEESEKVEEGELEQALS